MTRRVPSFGSAAGMGHQPVPVGTEVFRPGTLFSPVMLPKEAAVTHDLAEMGLLLHRGKRPVGCPREDDHVPRSAAGSAGGRCKALTAVTPGHPGGR